jgi:hypothetical protein
MLNWLSGFIVVKHVHPISSFQLDMCVRIFLDLFYDVTMLLFQW